MPALFRKASLATPDRPTSGRGPGPATAALRDTPPSWPACHALHEAFPGRNFRSRYTCGAGVEPATLGLTVRCSTHLSYPVADVPDSNRRPAGCEPAALPLSQRHRCGAPPSRPRHTLPAMPRAPDGLEPMPLEPVGSMLPIAGCCQPAIDAGIHARSVGTRFPHSPRRSIGTQRTCARSQPRPCLGHDWPDASGRNEVRKISIHAYPLQTPETERPRVWRPEGVRVASGDRGDRSPRRDQSIIGKRLPGRAFRHA
jgi:hypothetical protein